MTMQLYIDGCIRIAEKLILEVSYPDVGKIRAECS